MKHEGSLRQTKDEIVIGGADDLMREADGAGGQRHPWHRLLTDAAPRDHIVQLYQDQHFLNRAVCRFAAAALANGEGLILVPTLAHWNAFRPRLEAGGVDVKAAQDRGQLSVVDADEFLPSFMRGTMPDAGVPRSSHRGHHTGPRSRPLPEGALVGRDGQRPLGARGRSRQHEPRGSVRPARP